MLFVSGCYVAIRLFEDGLQNEWDSFIAQESINGNFLQSRRFLSYHPKNRFKDCSLLYYDKKNNLHALIPGALREAEGKKIFVSHPGSTYGGIVFDKKMCSAKHIQAIIDELEQYLKDAAFDGIDMRFPPGFMWKQGASLMEYLLLFNGYRESTELTTYIDYSCYKEVILSNFSQGKRTNVNNCLKHGLVCRRLDSRSHIDALHGLLTDNLKKFNTKPVHSKDELWDLYNNRIPGETEILGVFDQDVLLAAGWIFLFKNMNVAHTQYLCASDECRRLSPMTFLYYSVIEYFKAVKYDYLSWGISTENHGAVINWGLTESKESFGSMHDLHRSYVKFF